MNLQLLSKFCTLVLVLGFMVNGGIWEREAFAQDVNFPDENLAEAIRDALGLGLTDPITQTQLETLTTLNGTSLEIRVLTGLEHATNLTELRLQGNNIRDLEPLKGLTKLTLLNLNNNNRIRDLSPLAGLTSLTTLYIQKSRGQISDVEPLTGLTSLTTLYLSVDPMADVCPLAELTNLKDLTLSKEKAVQDSLLEKVEKCKEDDGGNGNGGGGTGGGNGGGEGENWTSRLEETKQTKQTRRRGGICPVGWEKRDAFSNPTKRVILHAIEIAIDIENRSNIYKPVAIEIYADPTEGLSNLAGWKLTVAIPYNHPSTDYYLTAENSTFNENGIARIESPAENPFPMADIQFSGRRLPGFDYRLFDENNARIDVGIACYRHEDLQERLHAMEVPRLERDIIPPYTSDEVLESVSWRILLDWTKEYYFSAWLVPKVAPPVPGAPAITLRKPLTTSWAALKKTMKDGY